MEGKLINIRKLVALDITLHGSKFILAEFSIGTPAIVAVGLGLMFNGVFLLGLYLFLTGINYIPLLIYAIHIVRAKTAANEVADGLAQDKHYNRKYSIQQLMIFIPLAIVLLSIFQYRIKR